MAKAFAYKHTDTVFSSPITRNVAVPLVNFGADFRVEQSATNEVTIANMRAPLGLPEKYRTSYGTINDVYKNTSIDAAYRLPSKAGFKLFQQHTDIGEVTDAADVTFLAHAPLSMTLTVTGPLSDVITGTIVLDFIRRSLAKYFEDNDATANGIDAQLRGILVNSSMK